MRAANILLLICLVTICCAAQTPIRANKDQAVNANFIEGKWQVSKMIVSADWVDKEGKSKSKNDISKGEPWQVISFDKKGGIVEYHNFLGRDMTIYKAGYESGVNGRYELQGNIIALETQVNNKPYIQYYRVFADGDKLLLKADTELMKRNKTFEELSKEVRSITKFNETLVLKRLKGKVPGMPNQLLD